MEAKLQRIKELIELKERNDAELEQLLGGGSLRAVKTRQCSICHEEGHSSRTCPNKPAVTT